MSTLQQDDLNSKNADLVIESDLSDLPMRLSKRASILSVDENQVDEQPDTPVKEGVLSQGVIELSERLDKLAIAADDISEPLAATLKDSDSLANHLEGGSHALGFIALLLSLGSAVLSFFKNEPVNFHTDKKIRLAYVLAATALFITSMAVPAISIFIGVAGASMGMVYGIFRLGQLVKSSFDGVAGKKQIENYNNEINKIRKNLDELSKDSLDETNINAIKDKIESLEKDRQKYIDLAKTINFRKINFSTVFSRAVATLGASLTLAGAITAILFPPAALILFSAAFATVSVGLIYKLYKKITAPSVSTSDFKTATKTISTKELIEEINSDINSRLKHPEKNTVVEKQHKTDIDQDLDITNQEHPKP